MTSKFTELAIDCANPIGLARFWCSVLDYEVQDEDDGIVGIGRRMAAEDKDHRGPVPPTLTFARVPEGKTVKNRLHLDLSPADREQDEEVRRLLEPRCSTRRRRSRRCELGGTCRPRGERVLRPCGPPPLSCL